MSTSAFDHKLVADTSEAEKRAIKNVARMLQRPDQLEKVDQFHKQFERKRMGVESRLKTAVQSQLEGVKTGIEQLSIALTHVREVKTRMGQVENLMNSAFQDKHIKEIKEISIILGGKGGGGRKDLAQGGGSDVSQINESIKYVEDKLNSIS